MAIGITWEGDPILYRRRPRGYGLIIRDLHYLFDAFGKLERVIGINKQVLEKVLEQVHKDDDIDPKMAVLAQGPSRARLRARLETKKRNSTKPGRGA